MVSGRLADLLSSDPCVSAEHVRRIPGLGADEGDVILVGVVHDHPASIHRASAVVEIADPDVVALELPALSVKNGGVTGRGEMAAAAESAGDASVVGIDGPSVSFVRKLVSTAVAERPSPRVLGRVLRGVVDAWIEAIGSGSQSTAQHAAIRTDGGTESSTELAADERRIADRGLSLAAATTPPPTVRIRDAAREATMIDEIARLRGRRRVVAVIGLAHLDAIERGLADLTECSTNQ